MFNNVFYEENKINITGYLEVPKYYVDRVTGKIRETCYFRNLKFKNLQKGIIESPYEEKFYESYFHLFDREIIIFIEEIEYWRFLLKSIGITDLNLYNKNFVSLDFFDPRVLLNVEIDSEQYHQRKDIDFVRDQYLSQIFGIKTIRLYGTTLNQNCWLIDDFYKHNNLQHVNPELFRFKNTSYNHFEKKFESELGVLETLFEFPIYNKNFWRRGLIVTQKDIRELGISEKSMEKLKIFLEKYYLQPLSIIKNSNQYTAKEAFIVLSQNCPLDNQNKWGQELLSVFEGRNNAGKYGTGEFIEKLNEYKYTWETIVNSIA